MPRNNTKLVITFVTRENFILREIISFVSNNYYNILIQIRYDLYVNAHKILYNNIASTKLHTFVVYYKLIFS